MCRCSKGQPLPGGCSGASPPSLASILPTLSSSQGGKTHGPGAPEGSQVTPGIDPRKSTHPGTTESAHTCIHLWEPWAAYPYLENRAAWAPSVWGPTSSTKRRCSSRQPRGFCGSGMPRCGPCASCGAQAHTHLHILPTGLHVTQAPVKVPGVETLGIQRGLQESGAGGHGCLGSFPTSPGAQTVWNPAPTW